MALEAVQASLETAHKEVVEKMAQEHERQLNTVKNIVDSVHGDQVRELQQVLDEQHQQVGSTTHELTSLPLISACRHFCETHI